MRKLWARDKSTNSPLTIEGFALTGGPVSLGNGAMQVYNSADPISGVVSAILSRQALVIAGDWRGVQYWIDRSSIPEMSAPVSVFDPSTMGNDVTVDIRSFVRLLPTEAMLNAVDAGGFNDWLSAHSRDSIALGSCVPITPPQFATGLETPSDRAAHTQGTVEYLVYCGKALALMKTLGLRPGDPLPADFDAQVAQV